MPILRVILVVLFLTLIAFLTVSFKPQVFTKKAPPGPIVFFGDSITAGAGANRGEDFPTRVGDILAKSTINAGVSGNTTTDALARIDRDVISKRPGIVVVEFGGNDFLQQVDFEITKANFEAIMQKLSSTGAIVVVVSTKASFFRDKYDSFESDLANRNHAVFVSNILKDVYGKREFMADEIHPNAEGYRLIAERLAKVLRPLL